MPIASRKSIERSSFRGQTIDYLLANSRRQRGLAEKTIKDRLGRRVGWSQGAEACLGCSGGPVALAGEYGNAAEKLHSALDRGRALVP